MKAEVTRLEPFGSARVQPVNDSALHGLIFIARHHGIHLAPEGVVKDNLLSSAELSEPALIRCARKAGLRARVVQADWKHLGQLRKALPALVKLNDGTMLVLVRTEFAGETPHLVLVDPKVGAEAPIILDQVRFEDAWSGVLVLLKRDYSIADETRPFSIGLITTLIFRERALVREIAVSAFVLSLLALAPILFIRLTADRVLPFKTMNTFVVLCTVIAVLILFETAFTALRQYLLLRVTARVDIKLATYMFDKVLNLPVDFFERTAKGQIAHDMNQLWRIRRFLTGQLFGTVLDSGVLIVFLPVMFYFSPTLTLITLGVCALICLWVVLMLPGYARHSSAVERAEAARGAFMGETLSGIRTIKSLALDEKKRHEWDVLTARIAKLRLKEGDFANFIHTAVIPLERFIRSGVFAIGVYFAITDSEQVYIGALFAFLLLSQRVAQPLVSLAELVQQYQESRSAVDSVGRLVNQVPEERRPGGVRSPLRGEIELSKVTFQYSGAPSPALKGLSVAVPAGTTLGIMGRSGSGKTTVTRLLQRLHTDYQGLIKIDGIDVREYDLDHLRRSLGVVLQENVLFRGTIRENIAAAKSDATLEEVIRAARLAGAEEFIDKLPRGYDTGIYEGSPNLSGGQRQRLAIARALITDPRVLILDEATSALDAESEAIVNANLARISNGRTVIVISHRLSSLVSADQIMVLESGQVYDIGRHQELLQRCDIYSSMWHQQNAHIAMASGVPAVAAPPEKIGFRGAHVA